MPMPDFQNLMLPLLRSLSDGQNHTNQDILDILSDLFQLTQAECGELLPSGKQPTFTNRVAWAKSHLRRSGLIDASQPGAYHITERGQAVLREEPATINLQYLARLPEAPACHSSKKTEPQVPKTTPCQDMTPQELIELGHQQMQAELATELLRRIKACPPNCFERLVVKLLLAMGYGRPVPDAGKVVGRGGDGGIDGMIKQDRLGLSVIYLQAKRWEGVVGRPDVQKFAGALQGKGARKGVFMTTSSFTQEAHDYAASIDSNIVLVDGEELAALMIEHNIGVAAMASYDIKRVDADYFSEA